MPNFVWKGKDRAGQRQEGVLLADNRDAAAATLRRQQIQVVNLREKGKEIPFLPRFPMRVNQKRIAIFTRQFSVMLDAGLPLVQCLEILGEQEENKKFQEIINTDPRRRRVGLVAARGDAASIRRPSTTSTSTWSPPARRAVSWTSSCSGCRPTSRSRSSSRRRSSRRWSTR